MISRLKSEQTGNKQPTQEQIKEFWEWCGFRLIPNVEAPFTQEWKDEKGTLHKEPLKMDIWEYPDKTDSVNHATDSTWDGLPAIDHNNLFKYAVPKLEHYSIWSGRPRFTGFPEEVPVREHNAEVWIGKRYGYAHNKDNSALALFWAIWEVIKNAK